MYSTKATWKIPDDSDESSYFIFRNLKNVDNVRYKNEVGQSILIFPPLQSQEVQLFSYVPGHHVRNVSAIDPIVRIDSELSTLVVTFVQNRIGVQDIDVCTQEDPDTKLELLEEDRVNTETKTIATWKYSGSSPIEEQVFVFKNIK